MLDSLLGRAELKARIEELGTEKQRLAERLDAESDRRADAVTARQEAEERVNRLEDRIAELEGRIRRLDADGDEGGDLDYRGVDRLRGDRLDAVLARLRSVAAGPEGALTAAVADGAVAALPEAVREALGERAPLAARAAPAVVCADDAGLVNVAFAPPLPPDPFAEWDERFRLDEAWFRPVDTFGFAVVRSDLFALGAYDGTERREFEGFETDVMNAHSKGGFSQARFERRRDGQIADHLDRCRTALADAPDPLYVAGERTVLGEVRDLADRTVASDARGDPEAALAAAFRDFWTARLYRL